jgi:hypothetical protein
MQVVATKQELHRLAQLVDELALGVFQAPGQAHDTGRSDDHPRIISWPRGLMPRSRGGDKGCTMARMTNLPPKPVAPPAIDEPTPLLGGLSPQAFMRRHWQKKPLLIRQAVPGVRSPSRKTWNPA